MTPYIFALIAYVGWGAGVYFEAIVARRLTSYALLFWSLLISLAVTTPYLPIAWSQAAGYTPSLLLLNVFLTFVGVGGGSLLYYEALRLDNRALVGTIASSFPIVSVLLSVPILGERISVPMAGAILLIITGLIFSGLDWSNEKKKKFVVTKGVALAAAAMLIWGIYFVYIKIVIAHVGWFLPTYVYFFMFPFVYLFLRVRHIPLSIPTGRTIWFPLIASTLLVRMGEFAYNAGISHGMVSIVAPISGANPTLFVLLAFLFLKDPLRKQQVIGVVLALIGIVALGFVGR